MGTMASGIVIDLATRKFDVDATRRVIAVSYTCLMMFSAAGIFEFAVSFIWIRNFLFSINYSKIIKFHPVVLGIELNLWILSWNVC